MKINSEDVVSINKHNKIGNKYTVKKNQENTIIFTSFGKHDKLVSIDEFGEQEYPVLDIDESSANQTDEACAKIVYNGNFVYYYIKVNHKGFFLNPFSEQLDGKIQAKIRGRKMWEFQKVNETCMKYYLLFLNSGNNLYLRNAERSIT